MPTKPTNLSVKSLKPKKHKYYAHIDGYRGLMVLVRPSGVKTWIYRTRWKSKLVQEALGQYPELTLAEAIKMHSNLRAIRSSGVLPTVDKTTTKGKLTVSDLCKLYIKTHAKQNKRSWRADELMLNKYIIPAWGNDEACRKTRVDMINVVDAITSAGNFAQARKVISLVSKVWNFAIDRGEYIVNPAARMRKPIVAPKTNHLTDDQISSLWYELGSYMRQSVATALKVQLLTATRINEVLSLTSDRIDFSNKVMIVPESISKNKKLHCVPLCNTAIELLKPYCGGGFLFCARGGKAHISTTTAAHELNVAIAKNGGKKFTSQDFRRTVETKLAMLKVGKEVRDRLLNHIDSSVGAKHYNQYDFMDEKREAITMFESYVLQIISKRLS